MRRGFKTWAEKLALEQRNKLNLGDVSPLPARLLADHLGVFIVSPKDLPGLSPKILNQVLGVDPKSWSAITFERDGCTIIIHNTTHSPRRQESNLMHEIAHILLEHQPSQIIKDDYINIPLRTYNSKQEEEAVWLGGCLQLPRKALLWSIRRGMNNSMIVAHFGASLDLVRYRRQVTGVDRQIGRWRGKKPS